MSAARIVGTTIGSMMMNAPIRSDVVPSPTTPLGSRTISCSQPASASNASMAPQRRATAAGDRPLNRGRGLKALPAKGSNSLAILRPSPGLTVADLVTDRDLHPRDLQTCLIGGRKGYRESIWGNIKIPQRLDRAPALPKFALIQHFSACHQALRIMTVRAIRYDAAVVHALQTNRVARPFNS